jgi:hypothetical protein
MFRDFTGDQQGADLALRQAFEGIFFLYYTSWNLFQILPAMAVVGAIAFVSGQKRSTTRGR